MATVKNTDQHQRPIALTGGRQLAPGQEASGVDVTATNEAAWIDAGSLVITDGTNTPPAPVTPFVLLDGVAPEWDPDHYFPKGIATRCEGHTYVALVGNVAKKPTEFPELWYQLDTGGVGGSAVTDSRGEATGDLLVFNGASFVRLPRGETGTSMVVRSDGTIGYITTEAYVDAWGAKGDGATDDTAAIQAASEHFTGSGGGAVLRYSAGKTYIVDGLKWQNKIVHKGAGRNSTILKAKAGSSNPGMIEAAPGRVEGGWSGFQFTPNGNEGQHCFYMYAQESGGQPGGVWNSFFENLWLNAFSGCGMWWRGGATGFTRPHQFIAFRNVTVVRPNTGASATTSRALKATGQCEKFQFDAGCFFQGVSSLGEGQNVGTNIELSREFLATTTLTAESAAGASVINVASTAGLEAKKQISVGEGHQNELAEIQSIAGKEVTLKAPLGAAHATGTRVYALSGTVAEPAINAPAVFLFEGCSIQNADLDILIDSCQFVVGRGCDLENQCRGIKVRHESYGIDFTMRVEQATEGVQQGTGTLTTGSNVVGNASTAWKNGDTINGRGIPTGTTVVAGGGTATLELSQPVEGTGSVGAITGVPLVKGGQGKGYIARFGSGCQGVISYFSIGGVDNGVIAEGEHAVRVRDISRRSSLLNPTSTGLTRSLGTATTLSIGGALEAVLSDAAHTITNLSGLHAVGERVVLRASTANTKLEAGGNIGIPAGLLTLAANDAATLRRTDSGPTTWVLESVFRASELLRSEVLPVSALGAAGGAATLDGSKHIPVAQLPAAVALSMEQPLAEVTGNVTLDLSGGTTFNFKLTGNVTFKLTNVPARPVELNLIIETGGHTFTVEGWQLVGLEPVWGAKAFVTVFVLAGGAVIYGIPGGSAEAAAEKARAEAAEALLAPKASPTFTGTVTIPTAAPGTKSTAAASTAYADDAVAASGGVQSGGVAMPFILGGQLIIGGNQAAGTAFKAYFYRVIIPKTGTLHDLAVFNVVSSEHQNLAVFDCGVAKEKEYTPLWSSGSISMAGTNAWQVAGDPALAVVKGQHVMFAVMSDSTTAAWGNVGGTPAAAASVQLPASYLPTPSGVVEPKLLGTRTFGSLVYAAVSEANMATANSKAIAIIGRIA